MNAISRLAVSGLLFAAILPATAQNYDSYYGEESSRNLKELIKMFETLGKYLGFDLKQEAPSSIEAAKDALAGTQSRIDNPYAVSFMMAAIPVNTFSSALAFFVPKDSVLQAFNRLANQTFNSQNYQSENGRKDGKVSVSPLIDQKIYQADPVSQSLLNIVGTPSYTYCMDDSETVWSSDCKLLNESQVISNVVGSLPKPRDFFSYDYTQRFLAQLNSNSLIAPFRYSDETAPPSGSSGGDSGQSQGLEAQTQAQVAQNFIRYATGSVSPIPLPKLRDYTALYNQAMKLDPTTTEAAQKQAQRILTTYLTDLRVYAAQTSVAYGNLYSILSKRLTQDMGDKSRPTSQAQSEFEMATWRLFKPDQDENEDWIYQINNAPDSAVQRQIAILLAEINYQLYLSRQQQERLLLTNSILLLQNARQLQPSLITNPSVQQ
ncbi:type IVB secretion system protein IcmX [Legionella septentrionalis]|uniref:Type IV secretion protein IcmX n=1 Tax=Legionella septentrionalis TaxID=2498109 RepID=A0A433JL62_9GAMM|nr:type IVB secretion system protein IcmX [Legionella septentrionalis]RUQ90040.1 type IV secretion protein IcmX [Legionella septentrionalis]RUR11182.1 type IV secretion protein IcmX [Legionella septentrionalis]